MTDIKTILIVDDDEDDRELFCEAVNEISSDIKCVHAENGVAALELLTSKVDFVPDYIFLDLNMPRLNGKQCLQEIKKIEHVKDVPVIIYSTSNLQHDKQEARELGAADFLHKPSEFRLLCKQIENVFSGVQLSV